MWSMWSMSTESGGRGMRSAELALELFNLGVGNRLALPFWPDP